MAGRPPIEINAELCNKAEGFAAQGMTMEQIALALGMGQRTLYEKKAEYTQFSQSIEDGQAKGIAIVTNALFERAKGCSHPEEKIFCNKDGDITRANTIKHYPPDVAAQKIYLQNRAAWKDKSELDLPGGLTIKISNDDASHA